MVVHFFALQSPRLAFVFELTDEFLFLRINAHSWGLAAAEDFSLCVDVSKLLIAFGMLFAGMQHFAFASQTVFLFAKQTPNRRWTGTAIQLF